MFIKLLDYKGTKTNVDIGDLDAIAAMSIDVITGDEILTVVYKDYTVKKFDSSNTRCMDFYDNSYEVYNINESINLLEYEKFVHRTNSYWQRYEDF